MELRYLRYFATVAELRNFTRASEKLHVAQPAISQQIQTLEEELGVTLLLRTNRSVQLTAAGHAFLREAMEILDRVDRSRVVARRAAQGETGTLSIGCFGAATSLFLPSLIREYRSLFPLVRLQLHELTPGKEVEALERGQIDIGFMRPVPRVDADRFLQEPVYLDRVVALLPERHPLAEVQKLPLEELAHEDWVLFKRGDTPGMVEGMIGLCEAAGFSPQIVAEPATMLTLLMMVASGLGVSLVPHCIRNLRQPGVRFLPLLSQSLSIPLVAAREKGEPTPTVAAFLNLLRQRLPRIRAEYESSE